MAIKITYAQTGFPDYIYDAPAVIEESLEKERLADVVDSGQTREAVNQLTGKPFAEATPGPRYSSVGEMLTAYLIETKGLASVAKYPPAAIETLRQERKAAEERERVALDAISAQISDSRKKNKETK
jgi:hypothetical protein